jgi:uncharacterized protein YndB with AHSA1/START domain
MKALAFAAFLAAAQISAQTSTPVDASRTPAANPAQALVIEVSIPAPLHEVWNAFTTKEGLITWLAPDVSVELKPGGDWLVKFPGSTGGGTIASFIPEKELVIDALAPDRFPHVRAARTHAVFTFTAAGDTTLVRLAQTGWQRGAEWDAAYEYLTAGNAELLATLHHRFVAGPMDWQAITAPAVKAPAK